MEFSLSPGYAPSTVTGPSSPTSPVSEASQGNESTAASTAPLVRQPQARAHLPPLPPIPEDQDDGWPLLAKLMVKNPGFEAFSRFRELNVKNLLYYQVELDSLRHRLEIQERNDRQPGSLNREAKFAKYAEQLMDPDEPSDQRNLIINLRSCLKEYNNALLQYAQISALPEPSTRNIAELLSWIVSPDYGNYCLAGKGSNAWGDIHSPPPPVPFREVIWDLFCSIFWKRTTARTNPDLVAPRPNRTVDGLTRWVADEWTPFWFAVTHRWKIPQARKDEERSSTKEKVLKDNPKLDGIKCYPESTMLKFTSSAATVVACVLPTAAIGVLTTARGTIEKLLYIGGFTAIFSVGLMFLTTETSRVQIFTATAAFSAVLVVFVQNQ